MSLAMLFATDWRTGPDDTGLHDGLALGDILTTIACLIFCIAVHHDYTLVCVHNFWSFWTLTLAVIYIYWLTVYHFCYYHP